MVPRPSPPASGQTPAISPPKAETAPSAPTPPAIQELSGPSAPAPPSAPELTTRVPSPPMYFVNVHYLALRDGPTMSALQILNFKDDVELLDTLGDGGGFGRYGAS
jgi:hypothetical protein